MGMFDSLYDADGIEWQTKAYYCALSVFGIGDRVAGDLPASYPTTYQVEILGGPESDPYINSLATIRDGVVASINDHRDSSLPLINYGGHLITKGV